MNHTYANIINNKSTNQFKLLHNKINQFCGHLINYFIFYIDASPAKRFVADKSTYSCLNGGYKTKISKEMCYCPPGFKGKLCETG